MSDGTPIGRRGSDRLQVQVREYTDADYLDCRNLWIELTEHHRRIYGDPAIGGEDPGRGFDVYLADPARLRSWVAATYRGIAGLTGLLDRGQHGEIEPVVVAEEHRRRGLGGRLIDRVVEEARTLGYDYVSIRPVARNEDAVRAFHRVGFQTLGGHLDLTLDLTVRSHGWRHGISLYGLEFDD